MKRENSIKKYLVSIACTLLCVFSIYTTVSAADMGPKPSITITVKNAPDEPYYIALLEEGSDELARSRRMYPEENYMSKLIPEDVYNYLYCYFEEGFVLHMSPVGRYLYRSDESDDYRFGYNPPYTFRVIIVTEERTTYVSEITRRADFDSHYIYDVETGELKLIKSPVKQIILHALQIAVFFTATLLVEGGVMKMFALMNRFNFRYFLKINIITQIFLNLVPYIEMLIKRVYKIGVSSLWFLLVAELIIIVIEAAYYCNHLKSRDEKIEKVKNVSFGVVANIVSVLVEIPVWLILMYFALWFRLA